MKNKNLVKCKSCAKQGRTNYIDLTKTNYCKICGQYYFKEDLFTTTRTNEKISEFISLAED